MATPSKIPQFLGPDGVYRENYTFTTDISTRSFTGKMDPDTVDMQVSVRGGGFSSDPDVVIFEGSTFTIPNPAAYPLGLQLFQGDNVIQVRSVLSNGEVTPAGVIDATLSAERDVKAGVIAPSGISVERFDRTVRITVDGLNDPNVVGYNLWASTASGGGSIGYSRINPQPIITGEAVESTTALGQLVVDAAVPVNSDGSLLTDPTFVKVIGEMTDRTDTVIQTDYNQNLQLPDTTRHVRTTVDIASVDTLQRFSFVHDRRSNRNSSVNPAIPNAAFNAIPETDPLYYVATAVYVIDDQEYESVFSAEVAASPLVVTPALSNLPVVSRQQIVRDTSLAIYRSHPEVDIKPGAVFRDTFIDPFSSEAERIRFIIGFLQAAQSFATLLPVDDPGFTGTSIPVSQSPYKIALKQAFFLQSDADVQNLIDNTFDQLAARRGVTRRAGNRARGEVTVYLDQRPAVSRFVPLGQEFSGGGVTFRATSSATLAASGVGTMYNPLTGRYAVRVFIQAESPGLSANLAAGQITTIISGPPGVKVVNEASTFGGSNLESNKDLAARADGVLAAVDSGTYRGYVQRVIDIPGVLQAYVVAADNSLMMRDRDPATGRHTGGKVDVWLRGENLASITDSFAFSFEIVQDGQFEPVGNLSEMKFRAVNADVDSANPLIEMLDNPAWGFEFKNETLGHVFDLTDVKIILPDGIQLSAAHNDPANVHLTDVFTGSYRFRTSNRHVMARQPVRRVISFTGDVTGILPQTIYRLFPGSLPLELGRSTEAGDYVQVIQPFTKPNGVVASIPSSDAIVVTGEEHVILFSTEYFPVLGVNPVTVHVWNRERTVEYYGPYWPGATPDFTFVDEQGETPMAIRLTSGTRITIGSTILFDYQHDENFVVQYEINSLVSVAQNVVDETKHITADVLTKESVEVGVDISATIVLFKNQTVTSVDSDVRTALGRLLGSIVQGQPLRQSDVVAVIEAVAGVSYVVLPVVKMTRTDGSIVTRERVTTDEAIDFHLVEPWNTALVDVFLLENPLGSGTIHGGGLVNDPRQVTLDEAPLALYDAPPNGVGVPLKSSPDGAFVIGNEGMNIPGYSDNATLKAAYPFATDAEIMSKRVEITQRRVLVSLPKGSTPLMRDFEVCYVVYGDTGVKNVEPGPVEYLVLGNLDFSYDEDKDFSNLTTRGKAF